MAFIDELRIKVKAGSGGRGVVRWTHLRGKEYGGPCGGNGGSGGDVFIRGVRDIHLLARYKNRKSFEAGNGTPGGAHSKHGKDGKDLVIDLPIGAVVTNEKTGEEYELVKEGQEIQILAGGHGGRGNESFKSSVNQKPEESTPGGKGEKATFSIELRLFADAGLIGLPSAGKSTLLNTITNTDVKAADYPFTTLEPNLGEFYGFVLADIPGLIEGASKGKGLGYKFLRHIRRTTLLIHLVSLENDDPRAAYQSIRDELEKYDKELLKKPEIIVLSKADTAAGEKIEQTRAEFQKTHEHVFPLSVLDDGMVKLFRDELVAILRKQKK